MLTKRITAWNGIDILEISLWMFQFVISYVCQSSPFLQIPFNLGLFFSFLFGVFLLSLTIRCLGSIRLKDNRELCASWKDLSADYPVGFESTLQRLWNSEPTKGILVSQYGSNLKHFKYTLFRFQSTLWIFKAKIVDDHGRVVPINTTGEICFRGYNVMLGYWEDKAKTDACIDPSGWFHSG